MNRAILTTYPEMRARTLPGMHRLVFPLLTAAFLSAPLNLAGCNTTEGVGQDIKSLGKGIEETADKAKD